MIRNSTVTKYPVLYRGFRINSVRSSCHGGPPGYVGLVMRDRELMGTTSIERGRGAKERAGRAALLLADKLLADFEAAHPGGPS